jgi:hypothetical protein
MRKLLGYQYGHLLVTTILFFVDRRGAYASTNRRRKLSAVTLALVDGFSQVMSASEHSDLVSESLPEREPDRKLRCGFRETSLGCHVAHRWDRVLPAGSGETHRFRQRKLHKPREAC